MILTARAPFDFAKSMAFASVFVPGAGDVSCDGSRLRKAFEIEGACVLVTVYSVDESTLDVWLDADCELTEAQCNAAYDAISLYLSLDDDIPPYPGASGFHQVKFATPFESVCWAILTQRLAMPLAKKIKDRMRDRFGTSIVRDGFVYRAFPSPHRLMSASEDELAQLGVPQMKRRYLRSAIDAFIRVDEHWLRTAPVADVRAWLRAISGIGEWSAKLVLVRGLGRMDGDDYANFYERALPSILTSLQATKARAHPASVRVRTIKPSGMRS